MSRTLLAALIAFACLSACSTKPPQPFGEGIWKALPQRGL